MQQACIYGPAATKLHLSKVLEPKVPLLLSRHCDRKDTRPALLTIGSFSILSASKGGSSLQ